MRRTLIGLLFLAAVVGMSPRAVFAETDPKLDLVLANQEKILEELRAMKTELEIIKVRASNR